MLTVAPCNGVDDRVLQWLQWLQGLQGAVTMARLTISEAARQAGISRQYLHTKYIKPGTLTTFKDELDRPYVDSADLLRVFSGRLPGPKTSVTPDDSSLRQYGLHNTTSENDSSHAVLHAEVQVLRQQLQSAQDRERWYQSQVESLTGAIKLLEHRGAASPLPVDTAKVEAERARVAELEAQLTAERSRGFFSRVFGGKR